MRRRELISLLGGAVTWPRRITAGRFSLEVRRVSSVIAEAFIQ
jgi:hypothetical protein